MTALEWLKKLISFDTTSRRSNLELIQCITAWLQQYHTTPFYTYDDEKQKANLFATIPANDGTTHGGIILSGHTDTLPVEGQAWDTPPFTAILKDHRLYGRGATDMKGFIAVILALLPEWIKLPRKKPLHLAFTYDEEVGCHGAIRLLADLKQQGLQPEACIVGEPTEMKPIVAHKGIHLYRCRLTGLAVHSSLTYQGCNAIDYAAQLIRWIRDFADRIRTNGPFDHHFDIPTTTISTNLMQAGNAFNTVPAQAEFYFEFRRLPDTEAKSIIDPIQSYVTNELLPQMKKEYADASITLELLSSVPSFEASEEASITKTLRQLTQCQEIRKVAYATEAGLFQQSQIPTILCGPGNIAQAHRANEYIELSQLELCETLLRDLVRLACQDNGLMK